MATIAAIVTGAAGRMGSRLIARLHEAGDFRLVGALERPGHPELGRDAAARLGLPPAGVALAASLPEATWRAADVVLDFSSPEGTLAVLAAAAGGPRAFVIGTTGFTPAQREEVRRHAAAVPVVLAPNMSVGVTLLLSVVEDLARRLADYDVEIVEAHHRHKKDAPSGTALALGQAAARGRGVAFETAAVFGRHGITGERPAGAIGLAAVRGGDLIGEHAVYFLGPGERIELIHRAHSRDTFAAGALRAARWATAPGRRPGLYDMRHVLGLATPPDAEGRP
ncbi:MAG TPA: 4-hydroxy-tetrahydrodipicolinate reductase [Thermodesulfobacteriota bacterium]|nr:4-hydroxy-tetrahydrodipicolinate reductase [Thermodesulfobacteriota bacterium]